MSTTPEHSPSDSLVLGSGMASKEAEKTTGTTIGQRLRAAWKRHQYQQIQRAIRNYSAEKHFLSPVFRPVAGPATMRMASGQIERNKLPLHADNTRPWLPAGRKFIRPMMLSSMATNDQETKHRSSDLPASLRRQRPAKPKPRREDEESPIILVT